MCEACSREGGQFVFELPFLLLCSLGPGWGLPADQWAFVSYDLRLVQLILCLELKPLRTEVMLSISLSPLIPFDLAERDPWTMQWRRLWIRAMRSNPNCAPNSLCDLQPVPSTLWASVVLSTTPGTCSEQYQPELVTHKNLLDIC